MGLLDLGDAPAHAGPVVLLLPLPARAGKLRPLGLSHYIVIFFFYQLALGLEPCLLPAWRWEVNLVYYQLGAGGGLGLLPASAGR